MELWATWSHNSKHIIRQKLVPPLRSKPWFSSHPHVIQWSGSFKNQKGPKDDSRQQAAAPAVVAMTDVVSLMKYNLRYMAHGLWSGEWVLSYTYQKRESETICNLMQYIKVYIYSCPETMLTLPSLCHNILVVCSVRTVWTSCRISHWSTVLC